METYRFQDEAAERVAGLGVLPLRMPVANGLALRKALPTDDKTLFDIIKRNPEITETVAWAATVTAAEDVIPRLRHVSNEAMDGRFVVIEWGQVIGYIGAHPGEQDNEFGVSYALDKAFRGQGYAGQALNTFIQELKEWCGARHIYAQIIIGNEPSEILAERHGFQPTEEVMGVDFPVPQQRWRLDLE